MSESTSKVVSHGSIYLAGNILRRIVSFVMLPIYTRYLTPEHYGTIELLSMVIDIVAILFGLRIGEAIFRFYFEQDDERHRKEVMFTSLSMVGALNGLGALLVVLASRPLSAAVLGDSRLSSLLALFAFTLIFQSLTETVFTFIRAQQRPWMFVGFSTLKLVVQLSLNIYFVVVLGMAVEGVVLSSLVSGLVVTVPLVWYTVSRTGVSLSLEKAKKMVSFSYPLVLTSLISFYMTFGDRYFLRVLGGGLDEVGVYALGYRFGFLLSFLVADPFFSVWNTEKYLVARRPDGAERMRTMFLMFTAALVWVTVGISIFVHDVLRIMSDPAFWGAYVIVPIVMLGYIFNAWASFTNLGLLLHNRTGEVAKATALSAGLITVGYLSLIPWLGGIGAALATAVALAARMAWVTWKANQLYRMPVPWLRVALMLSMGTAAWALGSYAPERIVLSVVVHAAIFLAFTIFILVLPGALPADVRNQIRVGVVARLQRRPSIAAAVGVPPTKSPAAQ